MILVLSPFGGGVGRGGVPRVCAAGVCGWFPHGLRVTQCYIGGRAGGGVGVDVAVEWLMERAVSSRKLTECVGQLSFFGGDMALPGRNAQGVIPAGQVVRAVWGVGLG
ncbi:hypothetical protein, partial [Streptomyces sp. SID724]|uniref:hypothetical protein n=1 Tax=Streptomyces sp. SID724 TaxID=2690324 RepID=UPI001F1ECF78